MNKFNFALIGCGSVSKKHAKVITNLENCSLVGVYDIDEKKYDDISKALHDEYDFRKYKSYEEVLKDPKVNMVDICTPSGTHRELAVKAANAKKHIIVEKPLALTVEDADVIMQTCNKNNVKLFVVKQYRYHKPVQKLKEAIEEERFGKLIGGNINVYWNRNKQYFEQASWRGTMDQDGGVLLNQSAHFIDLLQWLVGEPKTIYGKIDTRVHNVETPDTAAATIVFKNGAIFNIFTTIATHPRNLEGSMIILGEKGTVRIGGNAVDQMIDWEFSDHRGDDAITKRVTNPPDITEHGHQQFFKNLITHFNDTKEGTLDNFEGHKSLNIILAIHKSAKLGKEIDFDEFVKKHDKN